MGVFRVPRATTEQRMAYVLQESEIVFDTEIKSYFGGDGITLGGFDLGSKYISPPVYLQIVLTNLDIINKQITLPSVPNYPNSVVVIPDGGPQQRYGIDYSIEGNILTWSGFGLDNFLESGETIIVSY